jgi:hypothetical protein
LPSVPYRDFSYLSKGRYIASLKTALRYVGDGQEQLRQRMYSIVHTSVRSFKIVIILKVIWERNALYLAFCVVTQLRRPLTDVMITIFFDFC